MKNYRSMQLQAAAAIESGSPELIAQIYGWEKSPRDPDTITAKSRDKPKRKRKRLTLRRLYRKIKKHIRRRRSE